jgi:hypothetical protein
MIGSMFANKHYIKLLLITTTKNFSLYHFCRRETTALIDLYEAWNKPEEAEKWWTKLPKSESVTE